MELHVHENNRNEEKVKSGNVSLAMDDDPPVVPNSSSDSSFEPPIACSSSSKNSGLSSNQIPLLTSSQQSHFSSKKPPDKNQNNWSHPILVANSNNTTSSNVNGRLGVRSGHPTAILPDLRPARDFLKLVKSNTLPELNAASKNIADNLASHTCSLNISHSAPLFPPNVSKSSTNSVCTDLRNVV